MSKELEALENIKDAVYEWSEGYEEDLDTIETALKDYEEINEYNVASGIGKSLEIIEYNLSEDVTSDLPEALEKVRIACLKLATLELKFGKDQLVLKKLKALEIIKRVFEVDEEDFYFDEETNKYLFIGYEIKKEEYDLLKEVLL